jgi:DNA-binding NtrC family response regulator
VVISDEEILTPETWYRSAPDGAASRSPTATLGGFTAEKRKVVDRFEVTYLSQCLRRAEGNVAKAARLAGIDRKNFWTLMKRHRIEASGFRMQRHSH